MSRDEGHVVVGVDGSPMAWRALEWAADEAVLRGARLLVVHCAARRRGSLTPDAAVWDSRLIDAARARVSRLHPTLSVTGEVMWDRVAKGLLVSARGARLLVVGSHGHSRVAGALLGSTALRVALHAPCPAVVVRPGWARTNPRRIVVGVDGSEHARLALTFAFDEAVRRGYAIQVVYVYPAAMIDERGRAAAAAADADEEQRGYRLLGAELRGVAPAHPEIAVTRSVVAGMPSAIPALLRASSTASLLVVGSHGRGVVTGLMLGSTSLAMVHRAHCPVAVVRAGGIAYGEAARVEISAPR